MAPTEIYLFEGFGLADSILGSLPGFIDYLKLERISQAEWDYQRWSNARAWAQRNNPNPLPILMRALNGLWLRCRCIRQPCWRKGRWKSLT